MNRALEILALIETIPDNAGPARVLLKGGAKILVTIGLSVASVLQGDNASPVHRRKGRVQTIAISNGGPGFLFGLESGQLLVNGGGNVRGIEFTLGVDFLAENFHYPVLVVK